MEGHLILTGFHCEPPGAEVEQILQTGPQQLHHHHIVVALGPAPLYRRNTHCRRKEGKRLHLVLVYYLHGKSVTTEHTADRLIYIHRDESM